MPEKSIFQELLLDMTANQELSLAGHHIRRNDKEYIFDKRSVSLVECMKIVSDLYSLTYMQAQLERNPLCFSQLPNCGR